MQKEVPVSQQAKLPVLKTVANEKRCLWMKETHRLELPRCCPVSGNPQPGSEVAISYEPNGHCLEVAALKGYIESYVGGRESVRSMEGMIQQIAEDCAKAIGVGVSVEADLLIEPDQRMELCCRGWPT